METSADQELAGLLDVYLDKLLAGQAPDPDLILVRHPELANALACLDELKKLANIADPDPTPLQIDSAAEAPTLQPISQEQSTIHLEQVDPNSTFGKYQLLGVLGRGGMGVVYKAQQPDLKRVVAIKMILSSHFASSEQLQRFQTEARAAADLRHPHILQIYEAGQIHGQHYFAMQYVEGPSLAKKLRSGPVNAETAARWLVSVAHAVAYLHEHGIVHRDLKPPNILLGEGSWPYVTDFGLVKILQGEHDLTSTGAIVGTPSYMSPEQAAGQNDLVGPASDVYSLGAILYEVLTGRPPFQEPTPLDTLVQVLEGEPTLPRQLNKRIPRELELICLKALSKAPEQRYSTASAFADDLERYLRGESVQARAQSVGQRMLRWGRQQPGLVARLAVLGACAVIAHVYYRMAHPVPLQQHMQIMATLGFWAIISVLCQGLIRRDFHPDRVRTAWLALDGILLTLALILDEAFNTPLVMTYAAFIVASGLWFRVSLVWFTTVVTAAGYGALLAVGYSRDALGNSPQHHVIVMIGLIVLGVMVAAQVKRVRALSRYYEHRPLP